MKYYQNQDGYILGTDLDVDTSKLNRVMIIEEQEDAEAMFRHVNEMEADEGVFIPSIVMKDGQLLGESLNACLVPINETIEDYISNYTV